MTGSYFLKKCLIFVNSRSFRSEILNYKKKLPFKYYLLASKNFRDDALFEFEECYKSYLLDYEFSKYYRNYKQMSLEDFIND